MLGNETHQLKIIQLNINSIISLKKRTEFEVFVNKHKPHIILLSETKLNKKHTLKIDGYGILRNDRTKNSGGGTAILYQTTLECEQLITPKKISTFECCLAKLKIKNNKNIIIASIYKPPTEIIDRKQKLIKINPYELNEIFTIDKNAHYLIGGDFNSKHNAWNNNNNCSNGRVINEWYETNKQTYNISIYTSRNPTCIRSTDGSFIDFGFISSDLNMENATNRTKLNSELFSDHAALFINLKVEPELIEPIYIQNFKQSKWPQMKKYIHNEISKINIPIERNLSKYEIEEYIETINEIYQNATKKYIPRIQIHTNTVQLSKQTLKLLKEKKKLLRKKHRNKAKPIMNELNNGLKHLNCMIFNSIKTDYSKQLEHQIKNVKMDNNVFKNIKKISNYKKRDQIPNTLQNENDLNIKYTTDTQKANALADHFEKIHKITNKSISVMETMVNRTYDLYNCDRPVMNFSQQCPANFKDLQNSTQQNNQQNINNEFFTSINELSNIIKTRNSKKSSGNDTTSNYILKKMPHSFIAILVILMNHIINTQYIPNLWKFGTITAICKPNKDNNWISSYRPITQLSSISKLLEKKMDIRIRKHCETNNLLNPNQYGFQPKKSTEIAASKLFSDITRGLNERKPTIAILIDFKAAFDTIWHKALIYKMHMMNFDQNIICLVKNYITNRQFAVKINNTVSSNRKVVAGAPQGGILSAIFYLIYTNDFPQSKNLKTNIKRIMFADDTIIYTITDKIKEAQKDLNKYLEKISNYVKCWKLKLNAQKTEQISIIGNYKNLSRSIRKQAQNITLQIEGTTINKLKKVKYLGIIISSNFKSIEHINHIIQKVNTAKSQLKSAFNNKYLNHEVKALMYKQLIRPIILYACTCWMQISSHQMERLRKTERWFLRKITGLYKDIKTKKFINSTRLYNEANINRIDQELIRNNLRTIHKISNSVHDHIRDITNFDENYLNTNEYKPLNYYYHLHNENRLIKDNKLLIYNRGHRNPNKLLYVQNQNNIKEII